MKIIFITSILLLATPYSKAKSASELDGWTLGVGIISPASRTYNFSGKSTPTNQIIVASLDFESKVSPIFYLKRSKENSFGFNFMYEMIPSTKLTGGSLKIGSTKQSPTSYMFLNSFSQNFIHLGTEYRFLKFYIPVNLNFGLPPTIDWKSGNAGGCYGGASGYSAGLGYLFHRHSAVELNYRSIAMSYCENFGFGTNPPKDDYGTGSSNEIILGINLFL